MKILLSPVLFVFLFSTGCDLLPSPDDALELCHNKLLVHFQKSGKTIPRGIILTDSRSETLKTASQVVDDIKAYDGIDLEVFTPSGAANTPTDWRQIPDSSIEQTLGSDLSRYSAFFFDANHLRPLMLDKKIQIQLGNPALRNLWSPLGLWQY